MSRYSGSARACRLDSGTTGSSRKVLMQGEGSETVSILGKPRNLVWGAFPIQHSLGAAT